MKMIAQAILAVGLVGFGLTGLFFNVEYSGWVLFVGLLVAVS